MSPARPSLDQLHAEACAAGARTYRDPASGYPVFTAVAHEERGRCCGCGCRHCPFGFSNVPAARLSRKPRDPFLEDPGAALDGGAEGAPCDVLFWSGGKDSYLALRAVQREGRGPVVLLTTFEDATEVVAQQEIALDEIRAQARALGLPLLLVPLHPDAALVDRIRVALGLIGRRRPIGRLVFGDLHLASIRRWREESLGPLAEAHGATLHLPLWHVPYEELLAELSAAPVRVRLTAVDHRRLGEAAAPGDAFGPTLLARLPAEIDAFGEAGEFHTRVEFPDPATSAEGRRAPPPK